MLASLFALFPPAPSHLISQEIEDNLVEFLDKGTTLETDILANLKTVLPSEATTILNEIIPEPPNSKPPASYTTVVGVAVGSGGGSVGLRGLARWDWGPPCPPGLGGMFYAAGGVRGYT